MDDDFRFFTLSAASRLVLSGGLFAFGIGLELALAPLYWPGILVLAAGWAPLMLKRATNKPEDQGLEQWRPVPMAEIDKLDDSLRSARELRSKVRSVPRIVGLALGLPALVIALGIGAATGRSDLVFVLANAAALLVPALLFGRVSVYAPADIAMKMPCFRALLSERLPETVAVAPYLRFDKDSSGADLPEDLRLMLELKRPPEDFVGMQVQAAINSGPNGRVPYLYAVALTKGKDGRSYKIAERARAEGYVVEPGGEGEYGSVVIRQETEGGGYATTEEDCRRLLEVCLRLLKELAA
jgi:hypothetical protein